MDQRPSSISIHVAFHGDEEMSELAQLSGGQKSVVALAYMFALQKCDPSPVYIFDEIDANLDAASRQKIAQYLLDSKTPTGDTDGCLYLRTISLICSKTLKFTPS